MSDPYVPQKSPYLVELEPGTYYWCACGRSKTQPFCDGSHSGTDFEPVAFTVDTSKTLVVCGCKHSEHKPFCDGSHTKL